MAKGMRVLFLSILFTIPLIIFAQPPFIIYENFKREAFPASNKALYIDSSAKLTRWQLNDKLFNAPVINYNPDLNAAYWYRFNIRNESQSQDFILEFHDPHISELELYIEGKEDFYSTGFSKVFASKDYNHKNFTFRVSIGKRETAIFYARLRSELRSDFGFTIQSHRNFSNYALTEYYVLGMFYGVLAILAIYNLFLFFSIREKTYLYYVAYILSAGIHTFSEDGLGFQYVWPNLPSLNYFVSIFSFPMLLVTFLLYSNSFINFAERKPKLRKWVIITTLFYFACFIYFNFIGESNPLIFFIYMIPYFITYYAAIKIYQDGYKQGRFFVIGFSVVLLSFFVFFLRVFFGLEGRFFIVYIFNFGFFIEAVMLSYALGDKIKITKEESERAQQKVIEELERNEKLKDKVNRELETKVKERTIELEGKTNELVEANKELQALRDKLYDMNSALDKANWQLQREVKEVVKSKILSETVSYTDFIKIFPDNLTCNKHLEKLKWEKGFKCKKCGFSKFTKTTKPFLRKCASCKQPESVTAHTLFHAIKFPMNKAFYIAYITCENQKKMTIDDLSELLDLRRNTAWMFKKKVEARIEELSAEGKYKIGESWEKLVV